MGLHGVTVSPEKARTLAQRSLFHFTPRHGSWLNIQELEWSALTRQALKERVGNKEALIKVVGHWLTRRQQSAVFGQRLAVHALR